MKQKGFANFKRKMQKFGRFCWEDFVRSYLIGVLSHLVDFVCFYVVDFVFFMLQSGTIRYGPPTPFLSPLQQEYSQFTENKALVRFTV